MALPYANGTLHIGHLLGFIQSDIYSRFLKLIGKDVAYVCGSDMHGTPIVINSKKAGVSPEEFSGKYFEEHQKDLAKFLIKFDNYSHTNTEDNQRLAELFFKTLKEKELIYTKEIEQLYDEEAGQFLPDRFIKGACPKCGAEDQYGDVCESCNASYEPTDLVNPYSTITGSKPILKKTRHYYFKLSSFETYLEAWVNSEGSVIQKEVKNWLNTWLTDGLKDWCISRDQPYFGFEIPGAEDEIGEKKYFYVWLDAPIGYISSTQELCTKKGIECTWEDYWKDGQSLHFLGKDIAYFHFLFWPAMLHAMDIPMPKLSVNGFITVDGKKMSKSRGTFFTATEFYDLYGAENLRFYFASHSRRSVQDINLDLEDFRAVSNNVYMGSLGNFCFRTLSFAARNYGSGFESIAQGADEKKLLSEFNTLKDEVYTAYYEQDFKLALKAIVKIADLGNAYFQKLEPWRKRENEGEAKEVASKVVFMVNLARNLSILVKPIVPEFSKKIEKAFGPEVVLLHFGKGWQWEDINFEHKGAIAMPEKLVEKIELAVKNEEKAPKKDKKRSEKKKLSKEIPENVFPLDIRVGQIKEVKNHPNAEKLYVFKVDFGSEIGQRQIVAGLKAFYTPGQLLEKRTLFIVNLAPAKIRGEMSQGMSLIAEDEEKNMAFLEQDDSVALGTQATIEGLENYTQEIDFKTFQNAGMFIENGKVVYKGKVLLVNGKEVKVSGLKDGAQVM